MDSIGHIQIYRLYNIAMKFVPKEATYKHTELELKEKEVSGINRGIKIAAEQRMESRCYTPLTALIMNF